MSVEVKLKNGNTNYTFDLVFIPTHHNHTLEWSLRNFICERLFTLKKDNGNLDVVVDASVVPYNYFDVVEPDKNVFTPTKVKGIYLGSAFILRNNVWKSFFLHYSQEHDSMIISEHYENFSDILNTSLFINVNLLKLPVPIYVLLTNAIKRVGGIVDLSSEFNDTFIN